MKNFVPHVIFLIIVIIVNLIIFKLLNDKVEKFTNLKDNETNSTFSTTETFLSSNYE